MENTNCGEDCAFVKSGFCNSDKQCPFYCESIWQIRGGTEVKTVKDCHPKRSTLETNNLHYRMMVLQEVQEELRNRMAKIEQMLDLLIQQSHEHLVDMRMAKDSKENLQLTQEKRFKQIE